MRRNRRCPRTKARRLRRARREGSTTVTDSSAAPPAEVSVTVASDRSDASRACGCRSRRSRARRRAVDGLALRNRNVAASLDGHQKQTRQLPQTGFVRGFLDELQKSLGTTPTAMRNSLPASSPSAPTISRSLCALRIASSDGDAAFGGIARVTRFRRLIVSRPPRSARARKTRGCRESPPRRRTPRRRFYFAIPALPIPSRSSRSIASRRRHHDITKRRRVRDDRDRDARSGPPRASRSRVSETEILRRALPRRRLASRATATRRVPRDPSRRSPSTSSWIALPSGVRRIWPEVPPPPFGSSSDTPSPSAGLVASVKKPGGGVASSGESSLHWSTSTSPSRSLTCPSFPPGARLPLHRDHRRAVGGAKSPTSADARVGPAQKSRCRARARAARARLLLARLRPARWRAALLTVRISSRVVLASMLCSRQMLTLRFATTDASQCRSCTRKRFRPCEMSCSKPGRSARRRPAPCAFASSRVSRRLRRHSLRLRRRARPDRARP